MRCACSAGGERIYSANFRGGGECLSAIWGVVQGLANAVDVCVGRESKWMKKGMCVSESLKSC
jgi:hypothetical protein